MAARLTVSGKHERNAIKTITISDGQGGRTLWSGATRPGRMHDQTAVRTEDFAEQFRQCPAVNAEVDDGCRGLVNEFPGQVSARRRTEGDGQGRGDGADDDQGPGGRCAARPGA